MRATESRHVLDNSEDRKVDFLAEIHLLPHVLERDLLGCRDDDRAVHAGLLQLPHDGEVLVGSPGWRINLSHRGRVAAAAGYDDLSLM